MLPLGNMGQNTGNDLLSREIPVSSALEGLTTVFGMGTGVPPPLQSPEVKALTGSTLNSENCHKTPSVALRAPPPRSGRTKTQKTRIESKNSFYQYSRAQPVMAGLRRHLPGKSVYPGPLQMKYPDQSKANSPIRVFAAQKF